LSWITLLSLLLSAAAVDERATSTSVKDTLADPRIIPWLSRFERAWNEMNQGQQSDHVALTVGPLAAIGQSKLALDICTAIESSESRCEAMIVLAGALAAQGRLPEARSVASSLERRPQKGADGTNDGVSDYQRALYMMAVTPAADGNFDAAVQIIRDVEADDRKYAAVLRYRIARLQARFGRIDDAMANVEMVRDSEHLEDSDLAEGRKWTLEEIEKYRSGKANTRSPTHRRGLDGYLEGLRHTAGLFSEPIPSDARGSLDELEAQAAAADEPAERAVRWRQIAWERWSNGDIDRSRAAARACYDAIVQIPEALGVFRATQYALLADLCFVMGDDKMALAVVRSTATSKGFLAKALGSFTSGPLMISVLVRADEVPLALEMAKRDTSRFSMEWTSLGMMCAFCDRLDELEKELDAIDGNPARAALCLGVAWGLHEKQMAIGDMRPE